MIRNIPHPFFDRLDYEIMRELHQNARVDASKISRVVGANERTVRKRIDHLVESQAVRLTAVVNPAVFGYVTTVEVYLEVAPEHEEEVLQHLLAMQECAYIAYGIGARDMLVRAHFKDNHGVREFLRRTLPALPGVTVKNSMLVPRMLRQTDEWMPKPADFRMTPDDLQRTGQ